MTACLDILVSQRASHDERNKNWSTQKRFKDHPEEFEAYDEYASLAALAILKIPNHVAQKHWLEVWVYNMRALTKQLDFRKSRPCLLIREYRD